MEAAGASGGAGCRRAPGRPGRPAPAVASRQRPLEAPGEEGVGGALRRAGGARMLFLNELAQHAQRLRYRVAPALPRLGQGALDRPGRERSVLLRLEPERPQVGERAPAGLLPVVEDAVRGHVKAAIARRAERSPRDWIVIHRGAMRAGCLLAHGRIT